jgi:hypothetical protein
MFPSASISASTIRPYIGAADVNGEDPAMFAEDLRRRQVHTA